MKSSINKILVLICLTAMLLFSTGTLLAMHLQCSECPEHEPCSQEREHSEHNCDDCAFCQHYLQLSKAYVLSCQCDNITDTLLACDISIAIFTHPLKLHRKPFSPRGPPLLTPA